MLRFVGSYDKMAHVCNAATSLGFECSHRPHEAMPLIHRHGGYYVLVRATEEDAERIWKLARWYAVR